MRIFILPRVILAHNRRRATEISPDREASIKADLSGRIDGMKKQAQVMVDSVFSSGELGFQSMRLEYLTGILEKEGFR